MGSFCTREVRTVASLAAAVVLASPGRARADAGFPRFAEPDWSSLSTVETVGAGLALTFGLACAGLWVVRNPDAAARLGGGAAALAVAAVGLAVSAASFVNRSLPAGVIGLAVAAVSGFGAVVVLRQARRTAFIGRELGLLLSAVTLAIIGFSVVYWNLTWTDPGPPRL